MPTTPPVLNIHELPGPEPAVCLEQGGRRITLLGTAHVSRASATRVAALLDSGDFDAVAVELCPSRHNALVHPDALARMDLFDVIRRRKTLLVIASLALSGYQQRMGRQLGVKPGVDMQAAIEGARRHGLPVLLIDREIATTMQRTWRSVRWWRRASLLASLIGSAFSRREITEAEVERLKQADMLESVLAELAEEAGELHGPLIEERDRYMALQLALAAQGGHRSILTVVGAGHVAGVRRRLGEALGTSDVADLRARLVALERVPPAGRIPAILSWGVVLVILAGLAAGFLYSPATGLDMLLDWVLITGGLSALGTLLAGAHVLTILAAFAAAPFTTLNPVLSVGMVTATVEAWLRKPQVRDFARLREETTNWRGWWRNRVSRVLLIFLGSSLGAGIGTYLAGVRILQHLITPPA